jgi:RNA polymerase sigma factor (TIGR02999 family)
MNSHARYAELVMSDVTRILDAIQAGDATAVDQLLPLVYDELHRLAAAKMAGERPDHTLSPTALVHEAYLRLVASPGRQSGEAQFDNRCHFFAAAAEAMRRILIENARRKKRVRHGGLLQRQPLDVEQPVVAVDGDLIALDEALRKFAVEHPVHARLVELRYFAGLTGEEAARLLGISASTADRHWVFARAWLRREMQGEQFSRNS